MAIDKILIENRENILRIAAKDGVGRLQALTLAPGQIIAPKPEPRF
jgi:hypothetical protein